MGSDQHVVGPHPALVPGEQPQAVDGVESKGTGAGPPPGDLPRRRAINVDFLAGFEHLHQSPYQAGHWGRNLRVIYLFIYLFIIFFWGGGGGEVGHRTNK